MIAGQLTLFQVKELIQLANVSTNEDNYQYTKQFWFFLILMIINWSAGGVVVTFADAICFNLLGKYSYSLSSSYKTNSVTPEFAGVKHFGVGFTDHFL